MRTRQFRKVEPEKMPEFIDFNSQEGMVLIEEMEALPGAITTFQGEDPLEVAYLADKALRHEVSNQRRAVRERAEKEQDGSSG